MSEEFEDLSSRLPDFQTAIAQRIAQRHQNTSAPQPEGKFDPYKIMVQKKEQETAPIDPVSIPKWPEKDVKALEDYCRRMGIVGFNCGRMHPIAALAKLRQELGDDYTDVPLEERVPQGYEKLGTPGYGPTYPYSQAMQKKQILHG